MALYVGSIFRTVYTVYDETGTPVTPGAIALALFDPMGDPILPAPSIGAPDGAHQHHHDIIPTEAGLFSGLWSSANPTTSKLFRFEVSATVNQGLISLEDAKNHLDKSSTVDDDELEEMISVATEIVESKVGPVLVRQVVERHDVGQSLWLQEYPVVEVVSIAPWLEFGIGYAVGLTRLEAETGRLERLDGYPFTGGPFMVTYRAGRPVVSKAITHGAREVIRHLWETQRGGTTFVGPGPDPGEDEMFVVSGREYTVPRRVLELLAPEARMPRSA
jgi:hypothetical protein